MRRTALVAAVLVLGFVTPSEADAPTVYAPYPGPYTVIGAIGSGTTPSFQGRFPGSWPTDDPTFPGASAFPVTEATPRGASVSGAQAFALRELGPVQYACLDHIVMHESRWRVTATNRSSGAFGIPQSLPGSKMATAGADWRTNPVTQVRWMLGYIARRYGMPCQAWAFWQANRWY